MTSASSEQHWLGEATSRQISSNSSSVHVSAEKAETYARILDRVLQSETVHVPEQAGILPNCVMASDEKVGPTLVPFSNTFPFNEYLQESFVTFVNTQA